jgi:hypothetical protein
VTRHQDLTFRDILGRKKAHKIDLRHPPKTSLQSRSIRWLCTLFPVTLNIDRWVVFVDICLISILI